MITDRIFHDGVRQLLSEVLEGVAQGQEGFILNPGDLGFVRTAEQLSAEQASFRNGQATLAAHVAHVAFGLSLLNRWARGEADPFSGADWQQSWQTAEVDPPTWTRLQEELRRQADAWRSAVDTREDWPTIAAKGAIASIAHTAYHLGALRQMLAAQKQQGNVRGH